MLTKRLETVTSPVISEVVQPGRDNLQSRVLSDVLLLEVRSCLRLNVPDCYTENRNFGGTEFYT